MVESLRDALDAAYDKFDNDADEQTTPVESESAPLVDEAVLDETPEPVGEPVEETENDETEVAADDASDETDTGDEAVEEPSPVSTLTQDDERAYMELKQVLEPYRERHALQGMSSAAAVAQLLSAADALQRDPVGSLQHLAANLGVDLRQLVRPEEPPAEDDEIDEYVDPQTKQLQQRLSQLETHLATQSATAQQQQQANLHAEIHEFATAADESGKPLRPHFAAVKQRMSALLQSGASQSLEDAYDSAVWSDPEVRKTLLSDQKKRPRSLKQSALEKRRRRRETSDLKQRQLTR